VYIDDPKDADYDDKLNKQDISEGEELNQLKKKKRVQKEENRKAVKAYRAVVEVKEEPEREFVTVYCLSVDPSIVTCRNSLPNWKVCINQHMLTLDCLTLFFHHRSAVDKSDAGLVDKWAAEVCRSAQHPKCTPTRSLLSGDNQWNLSPGTSLKLRTHGQSRLSTSSEHTTAERSEETEPTLVTAKCHKSSLEVFSLLCTLNHLTATIDRLELRSRIQLRQCSAVTQATKATSITPIEIFHWAPRLTISGAVFSSPLIPSS
jgi:hypothetical protein